MAEPCIVASTEHCDVEVLREGINDLNLNEGRTKTIGNAQVTNAAPRDFFTSQYDSRFEEFTEDGIHYEMYRDESQLEAIMDMIMKDLSEPYSIYTYRYFVHNWPQLCFLAFDKEHMIGSVVCKAEEVKYCRRGYIAMLAIHEQYRRRGIAIRLVRLAIDEMTALGCREVVLETEITNGAAMNLYEKLGFIKAKRLHRYYLNGVDAFRLKLWVGQAKESSTPETSSTAVD